MSGLRSNCVFGCDSSALYGVPLHRFPNPEKHPDLFAAWVSTAGDKLHGRDPKSIARDRICDHHFDPSTKIFKGRLIWSAIPTINFHCVKQSVVTNVENEHSYSRPRREYNQPRPLTDIANMPGTSSPVTTVTGDRLVTEETKHIKIEEPTNDVEDINNGLDSSSTDDFVEPPEAIFSWLKEEILYPTEDTDVLMCPNVGKDEELKQELGDLSLYDEDPPAAGRDSNLDKHAEYQCNVCQKEIVGFRYTCVQCADWDLCGACEARAAHTAHYMLRVPSPRPYNEIQAVLAAIRQQLLSENLFFSTENSVKLEPEEEAEAALPEPAAGLDPLQQRLSDSEDDHTDGSEHSSPRRKRRRLRSSDTDDNSDAETLQDETYVPSGSTRLSSNPIKITNGHPDGLARIPKKPIVTDNTRRKPTCNESTQSPVNPIEIETDFLEQIDVISQQRTDHQPIGGILEVPGDILDIPGYLFEVPSDIFQGPGGIDKVPGNMFEVPGDMFEVPDGTTVYIEERPSGPTTLDTLHIDPVHTAVGVESNVEGSDQQVLLLRVPPDTNDAALAQALQSRAYVVMQPLAIEVQELNGVKR